MSTRKEESKGKEPSLKQWLLYSIGGAVKALPGPGRGKKWRKKEDRRARLKQHYWFACRCVACMKRWPCMLDLASSMFEVNQSGLYMSVFLLGEGDTAKDSQTSD